jgi:type I restriction enzyme M protein
VIVDNRTDVQHLAKLVSNDDIISNDCNLSVSSYVEQEDKREKIDIVAVNSQVEALSKEVESLRSEISSLIAKMEA